MSRIERALGVLDERKIECGLVMKPENIFYLTGFFPTSRAALILKRNPLLLVSRMDDSLADAAGVETKVAENFEKELELKYKKVAIEKKYASVDFYEKYLAGKRVYDLEFIEEMRTVKSRGEIKKISEAIKVAKGALRGIAIARPEDSRLPGGINIEGMSERETAALLEYKIKKRGDLAFSAIVACGKNSAVPHHSPSKKKIRKGESVLIDIGARVDHYNSDISRSFSDSEIYDAVLAAQRAGIKECYSGNEIKSVDIAIRRVFREYALEDFFLHSAGHGIGLEVHEPPKLSKDTEGKFKEGTVVTVEPGIYKGFGVRIEDVVLVGKKPKVLS